MAETLDFAALWPFELGRYGVGAKGPMPCFLEVVWFLKTGRIDEPLALNDESEVLGDFIMDVQDGMPDDQRQKLKRFIPRFIGSWDEPAEDLRTVYLIYQAIGKWLPMVLEATNINWATEALRTHKSVPGTLLALKCDVALIPVVHEIVDDAWQLWGIWDGGIDGDIASGLARMAVEVMKLNDPMVRRLMLHENDPCYEKPIDVAQVPGIYDAVIRAFGGALRQGKQGPPLDPWVVAEAAERFREAIKDG
jgi:hypothetical protein